METVPYRARKGLTIDKWLFGLMQYLAVHRNALMTLVSGFLLGRITNEFSTPTATFWNVIEGTFSVTSRPANLISWLALALLAAIPLTYYSLRRFYKRRQYIKLITSVLQQHRSTLVSPFSGLAWDNNLSLQTCPDLHHGWLASEIRLQHDTTKFSMPEKYRQAYTKYFKDNYEAKRFFNDGVKIMLMRNPASFSDTPTLFLETREALYSQVQFYKDNVTVLAPERTELMRKAVEGSIEFPHSLCLHLIIVTSDDRVVLTRRSDKVSYFPGTWSCSAEEQLTPQDLDKKPHSLLPNWAHRLLAEEFSLNAEDYSEANLRVLAVFLESDILNVSLCAHIVLDIPAAELKQRLQILPRADYEFSEWVFLTHDEVLNELFHPTRVYHPSSGYRMVLALIRRFGEPTVIEKVLQRS